MLVENEFELSRSAQRNQIRVVNGASKCAVVATVEALTLHELQQQQQQQPKCILKRPLTVALHSQRVFFAQRYCHMPIQQPTNTNNSQ